MPSIGWSEMLMLAVVAIVVVGPKELPRLMRVVGHWMGKARAAAREFQQAFDEMAREADLEEMRRKMKDAHRRYMDPEIYGDDEPVAGPTAEGGNGALGDDDEPVSRPTAGGGNDAPGSHSEKDGDEPSGGERAVDDPDARPVPSH